MIDRKLLEWVIDAASNDYEDLKLVTEQVLAWAAEKSTPVTAAQIGLAVAEAVSQGYLQPFAYSQAKQKFEPCEYKAEDADKLYFYATKKGKAILA